MSVVTRQAFWDSLNPDERRQLMVEIGVNTDYFRNKFITQPKTLKLYQVETLILFSKDTDIELTIGDLLDD